MTGLGVVVDLIVVIGVCSIDMLVCIPLYVDWADAVRGRICRECRDL